MSEWRPAGDQAVERARVGETRVAVVGHHPLVCDSLGVRLGTETGLRVVGTASNVGQCGDLVDTLRPAVVVFDAEPDHSDPADVLRVVLGSPARPAVVMLLDDGADAVPVGGSAIERGVLGLVLKTAPVRELADAVRLAARQQMWVSPPLLTGLLSARLGPGRRDARDRLSVLTRRELEVLDLLVEGLGHRAIAQRLAVSANTVRTHSQNLQRKLNVHSALAAVAVALEAGLRPG
jgi:DNA-binding NarL/FixJ family response regulator